MTGVQVPSLGADLAPAGRGNEKLQQRIVAFKARRQRVKRVMRSLPRDKQRMNKIFVVGLRPDVGYGASINGLCGKDLKEFAAPSSQQSSPRMAAAP